MDQDVLVELSDAIGVVREQLIAAQSESRQTVAGQVLTFAVGKVVIEFAGEVKKIAGGLGGVKFWVVAVDAKGERSSGASHKVTVELLPQTPQGASFVVADDLDGHCCVDGSRVRLGGVMRRRLVPRPIWTSGFAGFRFPPEVIMVAVRWYLRYGLSYRDVEELLAERGIQVDHVTVYRWVQRFTRLFIDAARPSRHAAGDRWFVDETYVKVSGVGAIRRTGRSTSTGR